MSPSTDKGEENVSMHNFIQNLRRTRTQNRFNTIRTKKLGRGDDVDSENLIWRIGKKKKLKKPKMVALEKPKTHTGEALKSKVIR